MISQDFIKELGNLINKYSLENESGTPDYILAQYLTECLISFNRQTNQRECFYGRIEDPFKDFKTIKSEYENISSIEIVFPEKSEFEDKIDLIPKHRYKVQIISYISTELHVGVTCEAEYKESVGGSYHMYIDDDFSGYKAKKFKILKDITEFKENDIVNIFFYTTLNPCIVTDFLGNNKYRIMTKNKIYLDVDSNKLTLIQRNEI